MFQKIIPRHPTRVSFRRGVPAYGATAALDAPTGAFPFAQSNTGVSTPSNLWIFGDVVVYNMCVFLSGKT